MPSRILCTSIDLREIETRRIIARGSYTIEPSLDGNSLQTTRGRGVATAAPTDLWIHQAVHLAWPADTAVVFTSSTYHAWFFDWSATTRFLMGLSRVRDFFSRRTWSLWLLMFSYTMWYHVIPLILHKAVLIKLLWLIFYLLLLRVRTCMLCVICYSTRTAVLMLIVLVVLTLTFKLQIKQEFVVAQRC